MYLTYTEDQDNAYYTGPTKTLFTGSLSRNE